MNWHGGLKVMIFPKMTSAGIEIWVMSHMDAYEINYNFVDGEIVDIKVPNDAVENDLKPFLSLPRFFAENFIKGIVEYANNNNLKTKDQTLIEGKLIATEFHLKDMQEITSKLFALIPPRR